MAKMQEFKCPCCGGSIEFDSSVQKMKCPFCDTEFDVGTLSEYAQTVEEEQPEDMSWFFIYSLRILITRLLNERPSFFAISSS